MSHRPRSLFFLRPDALEKTYSAASRRKIGELTASYPHQLTIDNWREHTAALAETDYILSSWGMARLDAELLSAAPNLKHIFYGAGSVRGFYTDEAVRRGVGISSAWRANAIPTAEFAHATIVLSLKQHWRAQRTARARRDWAKPLHAAGVFRATVGLLSLGAVGRLVAEKLQQVNTLNVIAHDPFFNPAEAAALGVRLVSLAELFATSEVVSLHAPDLDATKGLVNRALLLSLKPHATLVNTARGQLVDEAALIDVLRERPDLDAVLDVTATEPGNADSPLWDLPNVVITPHIAGSLNGECRRMGEYMVDELERHLSGLPLQHEVTPATLATMA